MNNSEEKQKKLYILPDYIRLNIYGSKQKLVNLYFYHPRVICKQSLNEFDEPKFTANLSFNTEIYWIKQENFLSVKLQILGLGIGYTYQLNY